MVERRRPRHPSTVWQMRRRDSRRPAGSPRRHAPLSRARSGASQPVAPGRSTVSTGTSAGQLTRMYVLFPMSQKPRNVDPTMITWSVWVSIQFRMATIERWHRSGQKPA